MSKINYLRSVLLRYSCRNGIPLQISRPFHISSVFNSQSGPTPLDPPENAVVEPPIPEYQAPVGESLVQKRARLLYQSRKRGMLENGLLLSTFAAKYLKELTDQQLNMYDNIINKPSNDWDIYHWMIKRNPTPENYDNEVMDMLKEHALNKDKEFRSHQPDL